MAQRCMVVYVVHTVINRLTVSPALHVAAPGPAAGSSKAFSDDLSPTDLVAWLSQQFQAKGLTLEASLGQKLIGMLAIQLKFTDTICSYI